MSNEEIESAIKELLKDSEIVTVKSVQDVNHKPHPYVIGSRHVKHASEHHSGMLGEETMKAVQCAHPHCNLPYDQHTSDKVLFLSLKQHTTRDELQIELLETSTVMIANNVDGLAFVETEEEFRITD